MADDCLTANSFDSLPTSTSSTSAATSVGSLTTAHPTLITGTIPLEMITCSRCQLVIHKCVVSTECTHKFCAGCYLGIVEVFPLVSNIRCSVCSRYSANWLYLSDYDKIIQAFVAEHPQIERSDIDKQRLDEIEYRALKSHFGPRILHENAPSSSSPLLPLSTSSSSITVFENELHFPDLEEFVDNSSLMHGDTGQWGDAPDEEAEDSLHFRFVTDGGAPMFNSDNDDSTRSNAGNIANISVTRFEPYADFVSYNTKQARYRQLHEIFNARVQDLPAHPNPPALSNRSSM